MKSCLEDSVSKLRVGVLFGGRSAEHEVSLRSAASVITALDRSKYLIVPIKIRKDGRWELPSSRDHDFLEGVAGDAAKTVTLLVDPTSPELLCFEASEALWRRSGSSSHLDVVFPVLHGTYGEDGTVQGLLELAGIPCVGASTAASALAMDKALAKSVLRQEGLPVVDDLVVRRIEWSRSSDAVIDRVEKSLSYPVFVKPANLGSSVGVTKVKSRDALASAVDEALSFDCKAVVEQGVDAREIELSVLGNEEPVASVPGEIVPSREFYDYRAKYIDDDSELIIPAPLDEETTEKLKKLGIAAFRALDGSGMARVDFLLERSSGAIFVNELNTIPGFTSISMYPKLWEASGLTMSKLLDRLIDLALERARLRDQLETDYSAALAPPDKAS
jgi:D-alanine-D-alanine ligase